MSRTFMSCLLLAALVATASAATAIEGPGKRNSEAFLATRVPADQLSSTTSGQTEAQAAARVEGRRLAASAQSSLGFGATAVSSKSASGTLLAGNNAELLSANTDSQAAGDRALLPHGRKLVAQPGAVSSSVSDARQQTVVAGPRYQPELAADGGRKLLAARPQGFVQEEVADKSVDWSSTAVTSGKKDGTERAVESVDGGRKLF